MEALPSSAEIPSITLGVNIIQLDFEGKIKIIGSYKRFFWPGLEF